MDGKRQGFIPANYVKILGKRRGTRHLPKPSSNPAPSSTASLPYHVLPSGDMNQTWNSQTNGEQSSNMVPVPSGEAMENTFADIQNNYSSSDICRSPPHLSLPDVGSTKALRDPSSANLLTRNPAEPPGRLASEILAGETPRDGPKLSTKE